MMKSLLYVLIVPFLCILSINGYAEGMGMMTGGLTGTYYKFGLDIKEVAAKNGVEIDVKNTAGSFENVSKIASNANAALAIVQSDVLAYMKNSDDPVIKNKANKLVLMFPFYNEEVHILAKSGINSLNDLDGKVVVAGTSGSGSRLTAQTIFTKLGVNVTFKSMKPADGIVEMLTAGDVDAVINVVGKPWSAIEHLSKMSDDDRQGVHLLAIDDASLLTEGYVSSDFSTQDYDMLTSDIPTIAVKSSLIAYDFSSPPQNATDSQKVYYRQRCESIGKISSAIRDNIKFLRDSSSSKRNTSEKWKEVKLDNTVGSWNINKCTQGANSGAHDDEAIKICIETGKCN